MRSLGAAAAALATASVLVACSSSTTEKSVSSPVLHIDRSASGGDQVSVMQRIQEQIQRGIGPQIGRKYSVSCPAHHSTAVSTRFKCYARFTGDRPAGMIGSPDYWVDVQVLNASRQVAWQVEAHG
jgi:hypothetical protein